VGKFIDKLSAERAAGRVTAAICLVNAHSTDTAWFQQLYDGCLCFTDHRIDFAGGEARDGSTHGSVFVYFGAEREKFIDVFRQFGECLVRGSGTLSCEIAAAIPARPSRSGAAP
jgi:hypothetical protein